MNDSTSDKSLATESLANTDAVASSSHLSLEGIHSTVEVPHYQAGFWRQWRAYVGPALLVSVGYMDPGNWGTDLAGGAQFKYDLLWVVAVARSEEHTSELQSPM